MKRAFVSAALALLATCPASALSCEGLINFLSNPWATPGEIAIAQMAIQQNGCLRPAAPPVLQPGSGKICRIGARYYDEDNLIASLGDPALTAQQKQFSLMLLKRCISAVR